MARNKERKYIFLCHDNNKPLPKPPHDSGNKVPQEETATIN